MNLIELHILQSFPVTCLNRDDVGSPKSATFGGVNRARLSSQCLKRATRLAFNEAHFGDPLHTARTKLAHEKVSEKLVKNDIAKDLADKLALEALSKLVDKGGSSKAKTDKSGRVNMPALIWLSPGQIDAVTNAILANRALIEEAFSNSTSADAKTKKDAEKKLNLALKPVSKAITDAGISDAPDIAMFGRMVANDASLNVEGATMFSHALSTHKSVSEIDFYSAVDDEKQKSNAADNDAEEDAGAGMIGTLEYNSATYYRYAAVNLDLLADKNHLGPLTTDQRRDVLRAFLTATLTAVPSARRNSMNGATLPEVVLGVRKSTGQPLQLVNAFEDPAKANGSGLLAASESKMQTHLGRLKKVWGIENDAEVWLGEETPLPSFLDQLLAADV